MVKDKENFCRDGLNELGRLMESNYPDLPKVTFEQLPDDEISRLTKYLDNVTSVTANGGADYSPNPFKHVLVYCDHDAPFAAAARRKLAGSKYDYSEDLLGCAQLGGPWALVWTPDKYVLWHEALHLLSAEDSYDEQQPELKPKTCEEPHCLMQYEPNEENCGGGRVLCRNTVKSIVVNWHPDPVVAGRYSDH